MTTQQLHDILDDPKHKIDVRRLQQIIYELSCDAFRESITLFDNPINQRFYIGEQNAFMIANDLIDHLFIEDIVRCCECKFNDGIGCPLHDGIRSPLDYCSHAKRKGE